MALWTSSQMLVHNPEQVGHIFSYFDRLKENDFLFYFYFFGTTKK